MNVFYTLAAVQRKYESLRKQFLIEEKDDGEEWQKNWHWKGGTELVDNV